MIFPFEAIINSEEDTINTASEFAEIISNGNIVALNGDLGSGKTFFVKAVCAKYNIFNVSSPSFAIINEYKGKKHVIHIDFYRIKKENELYNIGLEEYLNDSESIKFIEWAELFGNVLPSKIIIITLYFDDNNNRRIKIEKT